MPCTQSTQRAWVGLGSAFGQTLAHPKHNVGKAEVTHSQQSPGNLWKKPSLIWPWENGWRWDESFLSRGQGVSKGTDLRMWSLWSEKRNGPWWLEPSTSKGRGTHGRLQAREVSGDQMLQWPRADHPPTCSLTLLICTVRMVTSTSRTCRKEWMGSCTENARCCTWHRYGVFNKHWFFLWFNKKFGLYSALTVALVKGCYVFSFF